MYIHLGMCVYTYIYIYIYMYPSCSYPVVHKGLACLPLKFPFLRNLDMIHSSEHHNIHSFRVFETCSCLFVSSEMMTCRLLK